MSFIYKSLNGLDPIGAGDLQNSFRVTVLTTAGVGNLSWGDLVSTIRAPLESRLTALEQGGGGGGEDPSIWPTPRTLSLSGPISGSVSFDGSQDMALSTTIADGALTVAMVNGLQTTLGDLQTRVNGTWVTGYTSGPSPTAYGGNLNLLSGAVYLQTQAGTGNLPVTDANPNFTILQNGPINFGQQLALRDGELWLRGQNLGTWGGWNKVWTTGNLDPSVLLLKTDTATAANKLATARAISLTGLVTGSGSFDGSSNLSLTTSMVDGALSIAKVAGLQSALDSKFTGRGAIPAGTSLNNLKTPGYYGQDVLSEVTLARNYPVAGVAGSLTVTQFNGYNVQDYITTTNQHWRRAFDGASWTAWTRNLGTSEFDPNSKYDKAGGAISGPVTMGSTLSVATSVSTPLLDVTSLGAAGAPQWLLRAPRTHTHHSGLRSTNTSIELVNTATAGTEYALGITETGELNFRGQRVFYGGNFDPAVPVPSSGVLTVGASSGTRLQLRNDGRYSIDGGTTWREINESPQAVTDPRFATVAIGADNDILLYEESGAPGTLNLRTGSAVESKYFQFHSNGNFLVPGGRVLIGGNEAWHGGNFNPSTKLDATATAVAATKLATPRTINGVAFDGTQNITLPGSLNPDDYVRVSQTAIVTVNPETLGGKLGQTIVGSDSTGAPSSYVTVWNFGTSGNRDGQIAWSFGLANEFHMRGRYDQTGNWKAWSRLWTDQNFNPANKLDARGSLFASAEVITDWNTTAQNGWFMASGALNAPPGYTDSGQWLIGTVTVHNANWIQQEVWGFTNEASTKRWRRHKLNGTWSGWTDRVDHGQINSDRSIAAKMEARGAATSAFYAQGTYGQQFGAFAILWDDKRIWQIGSETNGDFKLWSYDEFGNYQANPLTLKGVGAMGIGMDASSNLTSRLSVAGGIMSYGGGAMVGPLQSRRCHANLAHDCGRSRDGQLCRLLDGESSVRRLGLRCDRIDFLQQLVPHDGRRGYLFLRLQRRLAHDRLDVCAQLLEQGGGGGRLRDQFGQPTEGRSGGIEAQGTPASDLVPLEGIG